MEAMGQIINNKMLLQPLLLGIFSISGQGLMLIHRIKSLKNKHHRVQLINNTIEV